MAIKMLHCTISGMCGGWMGFESQSLEILSVHLT